VPLPFGLEVRIIVLLSRITSSLGTLHAIQYHRAIHDRADSIVTRDLRHYRNADLPVMSPDAFLAARDSE